MVTQLMEAEPGGEVRVLSVRSHSPSQEQARASDSTPGGASQVLELLVNREGCGEEGQAFSNWPQFFPVTFPWRLLPTSYAL